MTINSAEQPVMTKGMPIDLFLVRHGESEGNVALNAAKAGDTSLMTEQYRSRSTADYRLSEWGREQAHGAGAWIRSWMSAAGVGAFDRLYCSPYARAKETAALLAIPDAGWQLDALLRERDFGLWEGMDRAAIERDYPRAAEMKVRNKFLWRPESGESIPDLDLRAREVLGTLARELHQQRVLCVTHEDVMWAFRARLEKMTIEEWLAAQDEDHHDIANCGILHYTRTVADEPGAPVAAKFQRVRLVDPNDAAEQPRWREIVRPRFTDAELLDQVGAIAPLWDR